LLWRSNPQEEAAPWSIVAIASLDVLVGILYLGGFRDTYKYWLGGTTIGEGTSAKTPVIAKTRTARENFIPI
jgi:hypothetical protein